MQLLHSNIFYVCVSFANNNNNNGIIKTILVVFDDIFYILELKGESYQFC